jgi:YidC/Oxa1 family membrane protein insertase
MTLLVLAGAFDWLAPVGDVLRFPFEHALSFLTTNLDKFPPAHAIGAYGLAIVFITIAVKLLLFPLFQTQLKITKRTQAEQRKVAPQLAEIRKRYKKDPQKLNTEMMALYREHGINPLSPMLGCLPTLAQMPILIGLYQAIFQHHNIPAHISHLFLGIDLAIPASTSDPKTWILPLLAGASTFIQTKMFTPPAAPDGEQESAAAQAAQVSKSMSYIMPLMITFFAFQKYALQGLVLYWIVSNIFSIFQQYTVNGWGQLPILGNRPVEPGPGDQRGRDDGGRDKQRAKVLAGETAGSGRSGSGRRGRRR